MFLVILLQALWGASNPISKFLLGMASPVFLAGLRMVVAGSIMLLYQYLQRGKSLYIDRAHWWYYGQIIFFGIYIKYVFRYWGLSHLPVAKMSFLLNITPFFVALFSYWFFNEKLTKKQWLGLFIGFVGLAPLFLYKNATETSMHQFFIISLPELAILAEIAAHSYALIITRKLIRDLGCSSTLTNGVRMFGGGLLALLTAFLIEPIVPIENPTIFFPWFILLIVVSNIFCHNLYLHLLKYYTATFLAFTDFLCPLFSAFYGRVFLGEFVSWHCIASGLVVFIGLYLFYQDELAIIPVIAWPNFSFRRS